LNSLQALSKQGQSVWLDTIQRSLLTSGGLQKLIDNDAISGLTSNPSLFARAIIQSNEYNVDIARCRQRGITDPQTIYEELASNDIRLAAEVMRPIYELTNKRDGYVSLEVSPQLATDTKATCRDARRLWRMVDRANIMIKIPATDEGIVAIRTLLAEGININVTLLFSRKVYAKVIEAFLSGLEDLASAGGDIRGVASVASFFVSRVDSAVDKIIDVRSQSVNHTEQELLAALQGKVAIANAKLAYQDYKHHFSTPRWQALADQGAQSQRLLWASTGTKNPSYSDILYVQELIGVETVTTLPPETMDKFRQYGKAHATIEKNCSEARKVIDTLKQLNISLDEVSKQLTEDGIAKFSDAFNNLLQSIENQS